MKNTVSVKEMTDLEQDAFKKGVSSDALMENAALLIKKQILKTYAVNDFTEPIIIVCGSGNNGGDGLALARHLATERIAAICLVVQSAAYKELVAENILRAKDYGVDVFETQKPQDFSELVKKAPLTIDALLGLGGGAKTLEKQNIYQSFIDLINLSPRVISIDGPSGINMDDGSFYLNPVKAAETYTLGKVKKGLLAPQAQAFTGSLVLLDIFSGV